MDTFFPLVEVVTPSGRSSHMQLDAIRHGITPRISNDEQLGQARGYAQEIEKNITGNTKQSDSGATLFEVTIRIVDKYYFLFNKNSNN